MIVERRSGREVFSAKSSVDCTAYGDLAAFAGAKYTERNTYPVCSSVGFGKYYEFLKANLEQLLTQYGKRNRYRLFDGTWADVPGVWQACC